MSSKIFGLDELAKKAEELRKNGRRLVFTNGCFDLLHVGHVRYLSAARALGDALAVGINGDASVQTLKGANRPLNNEHDRAEVLAALEVVNFVTIFPEVRATRAIELIRPAVYVKGGDYTPETLDPEERDALDRIGSEIQIIPFEAGYSTSRLIKRLGMPSA
jgi:D-glycero-beta-D-manno-heptose 1-phosphate adenylyltransferase